MNRISSQAEWYEFESARWREAVRDHDLRLASLDPDQRRLVIDAINADLERRKGFSFFEGRRDGDGRWKEIIVTANG